MGKVIIGFDIGQKGGIALYSDEDMGVIMMPLIDIKTINWQYVSDMLQSDDPDLVVFESVYPPPNLTATLNLGKQAGIIQGICIALYLPFIIARPQVWKANIFKGLGWKKNKKISVEYVQNKYPKLSLLPTDKCRTPSDGMADAVCLAEYGIKQLLT